MSFSSSTSYVSTSLELLHCDVWSPSPVTSVTGYRFYLLIVDAFTKYTWLFPMKAKSEVFSTFVLFKAYVENMIGNKIKILRSDSGGEFTNYVFNSFLSSNGIFHQYSCPHTPEQNGCVEGSIGILQRLQGLFWFLLGFHTSFRLKQFQLLFILSTDCPFLDWTNLLGNFSLENLQIIQS